MSSGFALRSGSDEMLNEVMKKKMRLLKSAKGGRVGDEGFRQITL